MDISKEAIVKLKFLNSHLLFSCVEYVIIVQIIRLTW